MRTLEFQRQRLEREIISSKYRILQIREDECPDLNCLNQLHDMIERNIQLIDMINQHLISGQEQGRGFSA